MTSTFPSIPSQKMLSFQQDYFAKIVVFHLAVKHHLDFEGIGYVYFFIRLYYIDCLTAISITTKITKLGTFVFSQKKNFKFYNPLITVTV